jgi:N-acetylglucosamine kinase-like BadF-type ATPase
MILVADSGSTKTAWAVVGAENKVVTEGLNPHFTTDGQFLQACDTVRRQFHLPASGIRLFFYGAGCGSEVQRQRVQRLLADGFGASEVCVETDLLGACRAVSAGQPSLVGILGTGSNACYFDGRDVALTNPSLGYVLGDEGSANHMGRMLLKDYLSGRMPDDIRSLFHETYPYSYSEWMDHLYHQPNANRFLASLARFATDHLDLMERENKIWWVVDQWHSEQLGGLICRSHCCRIGVVGGFAKAIESTLRKTLSDYGLEVGAVLADPLEGLLQYHAE